MTDGNGHVVEYFPGTRDIVPPLLIPIEVVWLMRLDVLSKPNGDTEPRSRADALRSLDRLVNAGVLVARKFSKSRTFARDEVLRAIVEDPVEVV